MLSHTLYTGKNLKYISCTTKCGIFGLGSTIRNILPRKIFGPRRDEVTGGWRKLHNEEFQLVLFAKYD
jgi:hypothetical protein